MLSISRSPMSLSKQLKRSKAVTRSSVPHSTRTLSTEFRSAVWNRVSERCVSCVPSVVALRKRTRPAYRPTSCLCDAYPRVLRTPVMRPCELRKSVGVMRKTEFAYPPASPKSTLSGVFERMKRAARTQKFVRMSGRLAHEKQSLECQRPAFLFEPAPWSASSRVRPSEIIRIHVPSKA